MNKEQKKQEILKSARAFAKAWKLLDAYGITVGVETLTRSKQAEGETDEQETTD